MAQPKQNTVIRQFTDKPTRSQSSCGLDNWQTSQLAEMSDVKFGINNHHKGDFKKFTLGELTSPRIVYAASCLARELTSPRLGLSVNCPTIIHTTFLQSSGKFFADIYSIWIDIWFDGDRLYQRADALLLFLVFRDLR